MPLTTTYNTCVAMNNVGVTLMEQQARTPHDFELFVAASNLFENAYRALSTTTTGGRLLLRQSTALDSLVESASDTLQPIHQLNTVLNFVNRPMKLNLADIMEDLDDSSDSSHVKLAQAAILFNLALLHQLIRPLSTKIAEIYHVATACLCDVPDCYETFLLSVACLNNFGVWCHVNGDLANTESVMAQLHDLLLSEQDEYSLEEPVIYVVQANLA